MPLEGSFERPKGFDLATFWAESVAAYERDLPRIEVIFRLAPRAGPRFEEVVGRRAAERAMRSTATDPDGWRRMRLSFEWLDAAEATMLQLGGDAEILEPAELREQIARTGRAIVERYAHAAT
jgi:predicted DNA-binding transcriptional regulator YafY